MAGQARRWCFTINNYTEQSLLRLKQDLSSISINYAIIAKEIGENNTPHLQGFISFKERQRFTQMKKLMPTAHLEQAKGNDKQNEDYCKKQDKEPFIIGTPSCTSEKGGNNKSYLKAMQIARDLAQNKNLSEILEDEENIPAYVQHFNTIAKIKSQLIQETAMKELIEEYKNVNLRKFQKQIDNLIQGTPDQRQILWYWDTEGNSGKTWFSKYLVQKYNALRLENGKSQDLKHAYEGQNIVIFDYSRSQADHINYEVLESIKNGCVFSSKYESRSKIFKIPHVIVFANWGPDETKLSRDRWYIKEITQQDRHSEQNLQSEQTQNGIQTS